MRYAAEIGLTMMSDYEIVAVNVIVLFILYSCLEFMHRMLL